MDEPDFGEHQLNETVLLTSLLGKGFFIKKRIIDLVLGIPFLVILTPVILLIAVVIRIDSPGNPFFSQPREGRKRKLFTIYKFRTLYLEHFGLITTEEIPSAHRVTRLGKYLRRTKLDELPQLWNVVLGDMSIVGPRPFVSFYIPNQDYYTPSQYLRLIVKPGLTGISQITGNVSLSWPNRIWLDVWYLENWSLLLDIKVIALTIIAIFKGEGQESDPFHLHGELPDRKIFAKR